MIKLIAIMARILRELDPCRAATIIVDRTTLAGMRNGLESPLLLRYFTRNLMAI
jgi:hypothetical protein